MRVSPAITQPSLSKRRRRSPPLVGLVMIAVVAAGYLGWQHFAHPTHVATEPPPPVPVIPAMVQKQNFPIVLTGIGNVAALNSATVRSLVTEQITSIDFKDGQYVKKGQLLAQLDPSTYQAQLDQAEANLARDEAISKMGGSTSTGISHCKDKGLRRSSRSPRSKRRTHKKRPLSKPIRQRSNMPRPSSAIRNCWRRLMVSPEYVCSMSATSFTRAPHEARRPSQMLWW